MDINKIISFIKKNESYRNKIYLDTEGIPTGGYGTAFLVGKKYPQRIWEDLFNLDFLSVEEDYTKLGLSDIDDNRQVVIYDLLYNLGLTKLLKFKNMLEAIKNKDWDKAADELLNSTYAKQTKGRAERNSRILRTGILEE